MCGCDWVFDAGHLHFSGGAGPLSRSGFCAAERLRHTKAINGPRSPLIALSVFSLIYPKSTDQFLIPPIDKFPISEYTMIVSDFGFISRRGMKMEQSIQRQLQTLNQLCKENDEIYHDIAGRFGLTDSAFWIMYAITHTDGPCTQNDLCNDWFYPAQTINSAVSNLRKKGLVQLAVIPGTKNRKQILLTEDGKKLAERTINKIDEFERNAFLLFSEEERETCISLYKRHLENLKNEKKKVFEMTKSRSQGEETQ